MKGLVRFGVIAICLWMAVGAAFAQTNGKAGILSPTELKQVVPTGFFFDDQVAPVQMRNAVAFRTSDGKVVAAGLVDNSGYSSDIASKYKGFLITSRKIMVEGSTLNPGQYGFGFTADGKFRVMDVGGNEVFSATCKEDNDLKRPVPLKVTQDGSGFRLYAGKKYVSIKAQ